jgi:hypothetical protein
MVRGAWRGTLDALTWLMDASRGAAEVAEVEAPEEELRVKRGTEDYDFRRSGRSWTRGSEITHLR